MVDFPLRSVDKEVRQLKLTTIIITERGGVCCSCNLNNLTACLRIYSNLQDLIHFLCYHTNEFEYLDYNIALYIKNKSGKRRLRSGGG